MTTLSIKNGGNLMVNKFKAYRFICQKTQDQLSKETGIPQSQISKFENKYLRPGEREQKILAKAVGATPEELFSSEE